MKALSIVILCAIITTHLFSEDINRIVEAIKDFNNNEVLLGMDKINKVLEVDPNNALAYYARGVGYFQFQRQYDKAIYDFTKSIELYKKQDDKQKLFIPYYYRGICNYEIKNYTSSITDYNNALAIKSDSSVYYSLAQAYYQINDYNRSYKYCILSLDVDVFNDRPYRFIFTKLTDNIDDTDKIYLNEKYNCLNKLPIKVKDNIYKILVNMSTIEYNAINGKNGYYEILMNTNGQLLRESNKYIEIDKVIGFELIASDFKRVMNSYAVIYKNIPNSDKCKIIGAKVLHYYIDDENTIHIIYKIKYDTN